MMPKEFKIALVTSILLHLLMILFFQWAQDILPSPTKATAIEVFLQQPDGGFRLADIPEPLIQQKPGKSKFLGMYNNKTSEETVAKSHPEASNIERKTAKSHKESITKQEPSKKQFHDLYAMKSPVEKEVKKKKERNEVSNGAPVGSFASIPEDYFPDFKYGEHTYLNVLRYPDVEYFVRLKRIFRTTWNPVSALRQDMQAMSVSRGSVSVVLAVSVDKNGEMPELFVLRSSGLPTYDSEALRTVKASSPFASPPEKFLEKDDVLRMSWTFVVYL